MPLAHLADSPEGLLLTVPVAVLLGFLAWERWSLRRRRDDEDRRGS